VLTLAAFIAMGLYLAIAVHEAAHAFAARRLSFHVKVVTIGWGPRCFSWHDKAGTVWDVRALPFGGNCQFITAGDSRSADGLASFENQTIKMSAVFLAGPVASLAFGLLVLWAGHTLAVYQGWGLHSHDSAMIWSLAWFTLAVGIINLLPIPPFDGGHALLLVIEHFRGAGFGQNAEKALIGYGLGIFAATSAVALTIAAHRIS